MYKRYIEAHFGIHCCRAKAICVTYSDCVPVALLIQNKKRMLRVIWSYVTCSVEQYLSILCLLDLHHLDS